MRMNALQEKLRDLNENRKIGECLIRHYSNILEHYDDIVTKLDEEIELILAKKEEVLLNFVAAPEELVKLKRHLEETIAKEKELKTGGKDKVKKIARMKTRITNLKQKLEELERIERDAKENDTDK